MSNASEYQGEHAAGRWIKSSITRRCSKYFGTYANCKGIITPGAECFDTEEETTDGKRGSHWMVCSACAHNQPLPKAVRRSAA